MVDTVLLHTTGSEARATQLAAALTDRQAITYAVKAEQRSVGFGPQVVVVGVVPESAQGDEARLLEIVSASPGLRLILTPPNAPPLVATDCVVVAGGVDAQADAEVVRAAIANAFAAKDDGKRKKKKQTEAKVRIEGRPAPAQKPERAPKARVERIDREERAEKAEREEKPAKPFDAGSARRARKVGYAFGVFLGAALAVAAVLLFVSFHATPHAPAQAAPAPAETQAAAPAAATTAAPAPAPAATQPSGPAETTTAPPVETSAAPTEDTELRGHTEDTQP